MVGFQRQALRLPDGLCSGVSMLYVVCMNSLECWDVVPQGLCSGQGMLNFKIAWGLVLGLCSGKFPNNMIELIMAHVG